MMRGRFAILSMGVALSILGNAGLSRAEPPGPKSVPIHVINIRTDDADDQAEALSQAIKTELRGAVGWSLGEGDYSLEIISLALKCPNPPDAACELRIADQIKSSRYIWGTMKRSPGGRVTATLHLWARGQGQTKTDVSFKENVKNPNDSNLRAMVREALQTLTGGPPKGSVTIKAGDVNGQVFVDGELSGSIKDGSVTLFMAAGNHTVEVRAPGYDTLSGEVMVNPAGTVDLDLSPKTKEEGAKPVATGGAKEEPINYQKIGGYAGLGLGAVLGGLGFYFMYENTTGIPNQDDFKAYGTNLPQKYVPEGKSSPDVCRAADDGYVSSQPGAASPSTMQGYCDKSSTYRAYQWVFLSVGAAALGTGTYLLLTDKPSQQSKEPSMAARVRVLPAISPGRGSLDVHVTF